MKKLILLTLLLGLSGCGDNNQSDTSQSKTQANTLQKVEATPAVANYSLAASPHAMSAVAPLQGWNVLSSATLGAETIIEAGKGQLGSIASIRPNAKQVAEVLRGGAAGIALTIAVDQLLGAVDWVMDPENNQIKYKEKIKDNPEYVFVLDSRDNPKDGYATAELACKAAEYSKAQALKQNNYLFYPNLRYVGKTSGGIHNCVGTAYNTFSGVPYDGDYYVQITEKLNPNYNPPVEKTLPLEVVAGQVISNADTGSLDAQVATNLAAHNILNDVVQAEPVVQELEENAKYAGRAPRPNNISHDRENEILDMKPNDPCDEISKAIKDLDETVNWRKSDLNPDEKGRRGYVGHQKRIRILNDKKEEMNRAYKVWCEG